MLCRQMLSQRRQQRVPSLIASLTLFVDRVIDGGPDTVTTPDDALSVRDYPI